MTTDNDVFGSAGVPEELIPRYFDLLELDGWHGVFNPRPERYDENNTTHKQLVAEKGLVVFYEYTFIPVGSKGQVITRTATKNSREWREIFNSLKEVWGMTDDVEVSKRIGNTFHVDNKGAYVARELVAIGKYTHKTTGEEKTNWASKIVEVFPNEDACLAAHDAFYGIASATGDIPGFDVEPAAAPANFGDKETAMVFLPQFINMAMGENHKVDWDKLKESLQNNPPFVNNGLTIDSEEVKEAVRKAESEPPF